MVNKKNLRSEWLISDEFNNQRIDYFLKKKIPNLNFPTLCTLLRKGIVKINNKKVKNSYVLNKGDHIISSFSCVKPLLKNKISIKKKLFFESLIIFKNQNYYIINKPSGLAVQGGTKVNFNLDMVLESLKSDALDKPKLVHRIDKQTSGVLVISRNLKTAKYFGELFKSRSIEKIYITIVHGIPQNKEGIIETPLVYNDRVHQSKTKYKVLESKNN